jgi:hypothetical protein
MYVFDKSRWPIVVVTHKAYEGDAEFASFLTHLNALVSQPEHYIYIDVQPATFVVPPIARFRMLALWYREHAEICERLCVGSATVIPSAAARGALRVFLEMSRARVKRYAAKDLSDALNWAEARLAVDRRRSSSSTMPATMPRISVPPRRESKTWSVSGDGDPKETRVAHKSVPIDRGTLDKGSGRR